VLFCTWEDEVEELARRWNAAYRAGALQGSDTKPNPSAITILNMRNVVGSSALWTPEGTKHIANQATWTKCGQVVLEQMEDHGLAIIDPIAAAFLS